MYIFVNDNKNVLITQSKLLNPKVSFRLQELEEEFTAIIIRASVTPAPAIQIHSSVGGLNHLNVFGEEPVQIMLEGKVAGSSCDAASRIESGLSRAVDIFSTYGVVQRAEPLSMKIGSGRVRAAFLVGLTASQNEAFADVADIQIQLIAEPLAEIGDPTPIGSGDVAADPAPESGGSSDAALLPASSNLSRTVSTTVASAIPRLVLPAGVQLASRGANSTAALQTLVASQLLASGEASSSIIVPASALGYIADVGGTI